MTSFYTMLFLAVGSTAGLYVYGRLRPVGKPITWGEGILAALGIFAYLALIYALLPNAWLQWATGGLRWRPDKTGIPLGPLHYTDLWGWRFHILQNNRKYLGFIPVDHGVVWPHGITFFGRGKIAVNAQNIGDSVAALIYIVFLGVQLYGWLWWQKRGRVRVATPELPRSAYGRPLVKKA